MRVHEMFYLVNTALETWVEPSFSERKVGSEVVSYSCQNAGKIVSLLNPLMPFPIIKEHINTIYSTHDTFYKGAPGALTKDEKNKIAVSMQKIKSILLTIQSMCEALGVELDSCGFDIKLPPNMALSELSECTKDLNHVFTQCPLLHSDDEQIQFRGVDVGSMWLTFAIIGAGSATAFYILKNIAAMVDSILVIRSHAAVCKQQEELVRQAKLKNDMLQTIVDANKQAIKTLTRKAAEELAAENNLTSNDDIAHIEGSLNKLKEWIDKGLEVYAAVDAPKEVKAVFSPLEMQSLPDFEVKGLEAHKDDTEK